MGWLAVISLLPANSVAELTKLPALLCHYLHTHLVQDAAMGFGEFLAEHYMEAEQATHHQRPHDHSQLPFYHTGSAVVFLAPAVVWSAGLLSVPSPKPEVPYLAVVIGAAASAVFQPPKA